MNYTKDDLILPEYGRNIQQMVDYALTIEDREERTRCAHAIVACMGNLFPYLRDINDFKHILWDHLAIMSNFKLDIDCPYEMLKAEEIIETRPEKVSYPHSDIKYMHYGNLIEKMIEYAVDMQDAELKKAFIHIIANQMKKCFLTWNKENVSDEKIFKDLYELSDGNLNYTANDIKLSESKDLFQKRKQNNKNNNNKNKSFRKNNN